MHAAKQCCASYIYTHLLTVDAVTTITIIIVHNNGQNKKGWHRKGHLKALTHSLTHSPRE